jgi:ribonucleoside-diphosphate reductase beta chain
MPPALENSKADEPAAPETRAASPEVSTTDRGEESKTADFVEPMLRENKKRYTIEPIQHPRYYEHYKKMQSLLWTKEEIPLTQDVEDFDFALNEDERFFLKNVLAFFAASDGIVNENIAENFVNEVQWPEIRMCYGVQTYIEGVHNETYSMVLSTLVRDPEEAAFLFNALETLPAVKAKAEWTLKYRDPATRTFGERLVAWACVEGIQFSGSFCAIFWLKQRGLMPGLSFANALISRDEGLHCEQAVMMVNDLERPPAPEVIREIIASAVDTEVTFITKALPVALIGMDADQMTQYIRYVADQLCQRFKVPKLYNVDNPFPWMELIAVRGKANFFENKVGEYIMSNTGAAATKKFSEDEDF